MTSSVELALQIDRLMRRIHADLHPRAGEFDHEGVGPIGGMLLLTIGESEPVGMQTVISRMGRDKSQMTRLIQRLERKGLVQKHRSETDAREIILSLTHAGQRQLESIQLALSDVTENIFCDLSEQETQAFQAMLTRLLDDPL